MPTVLAALRPRFIDADGVHCAVGHMIAVSGSPDLSRSINTEHEYAVVPDIRTPGLTEWATAHGFTVAELTAIQPRYGFEDHPARLRETIDQVIARSKDELVLVCAVHTAEDAVTLVEKGDSVGVVTVTTTNKSSFAACFAKHINDRRARSPYDRRSENFERTIGVRLPTPQDLLEKRLARLDVRDGCVPRPGAIPTKVTIELDSASTPLGIQATTAPANREIDRCITAQVTSWVTAFAAVPNLKLTKVVALRPHVSSIAVRDVVRSYAPRYATDCHNAETTPARLTIDVTAKRDDAQFTFAISSTDATFTTCVTTKLQKELRVRFAVRRERPEHKATTYFRIDSDVKASATIKVETPAQRTERNRRYAEQRRKVTRKGYWD